jgi:hypothetical protein
MATDWFLEEYKIVQIKIDEVLKSQFQVRGWSVTLLTASVFGIVGTGRSPLWLAFSLPVVGMFQLLDLRQTSFRKTLATRATELERAINLLGLPTKEFGGDEIKRWAKLRVLVPTLRSVPGVAWVLAEHKVGLGYTKRHAETVFYAAQYGTISFILSLHTTRIGVCGLSDHICELLTFAATGIRMLLYVLKWLCG